MRKKTFSKFLENIDMYSDVVFFERYHNLAVQQGYIVKQNEPLCLWELTSYVN